MDIQKWLEETVQSGPSPPSLASVARIEPCNMFEKADPMRQSSHRRKQSRSDSSLLPLPPRHTPHTKKRRPPTERNTTDESAGSEVSDATHTESAESSTSSQRYARKPRRKTRPERYEPPSKPVRERGKHAHGRPKGESKKSRRKSRRRIGEQPGSGIVQTFHAKNVSRDRLTLKPREQLGIFNKGKTSTAVKGRGLPDLVFSEMKFLQRHEDQPEAAPTTRVSQKKRLEDQVYGKEGEISAFFTSVRPSLVANAEFNITKDGLQTCNPSQEACSYSRDKSSAIKAVLPSVEVQNKGPHRQKLGKRLYYRSTSYVSWSESIRAPSIVPADSRIQPVICAGVSGTINDGVGERIPEQEGTTRKPPGIQPLCGQAINDGSVRLRVLSTKMSHGGVSRSHSVPRQTSSPARMDLIDRTAEVRHTVRADSPSSMPASLPAVSNIKTPRIRAPDNREESRSNVAPVDDTTVIPSDCDMLHGKFDNKAVGIEDSWDFKRFLKQCYSAHQQKTREAGSPHAYGLQVDTAPTTKEEKWPFQTGSWCLSDRIPTIRCTEGGNSARTIPNFARARIYEQQAKLQRNSVQPEVPLGLIENFYQFEQFYIKEDDGGIYDGEAYEGDPLEPASQRLQGETGMFEAEEAYLAEDCVRQLGQGNELILSSFWRPNKLY